ncbi:MAG: complex I NDUFA9 subunit family protein [Thiomonas sp.]|uniref:NADH UBIQUINONE OXIDOREDUCTASE 1 ALPHA SUBUNIT n=1 Tax=Thiomonas arsenitoxydans (strain DSM 22701 / CIP 110005 / 3As) TaxID=426114 RepID=D6CLU9_THIA3|nr:complex I NDUFA9 subunit family protein [Thiomonas arsenitoxydans]CQR43590.1 putative NADH UBIQUINONE OXIDOREDUCTASE 1 ALPHA SUBUNIT [Thiomonas sp. CB3]CAZ89527.1 putative NADH UBIQUINONE OXIDOREDUCTASE 1 ALPHA SUBUNIT [Thiomonas arsenitoxydans]CQR27014.1 putative NADH UBIQUINONE OXIDOREDUCTASE 1 ALPHA SUBUNIT [Thiomonas arsenitoxydans]CQR36153.1 putative NADH UBIQUINONE OXIDOREDUCTASE 1 ALPHA SUBUNIT [Thiomonas arsenitoxydans]CQR38490.1 putative NADH UBIQUINONE OXIDOREDUCTASE 1 ALPHA SUBUN
MQQQNILVIGGSGFIGSRLVNALSLANHFVTVPTRRRQRARHLVQLPLVDVVEIDVHDDAKLAKLVAGRDAVVNLVGILQGRRGQPYGADFARAHVDLPRRIAAACAQQGVRRVVHMSALGADSKGPSMYLRSKGDGEAALKAQAGIDLTIFRPSVVFGPEDNFLNTFAKLQRVFPVVPLAGAKTRFAPVYVGDVVTAFASSLVGPQARETLGQTYELCGPGTYTLAELVRLSGQWARVGGGRGRSIIPLPDALGRLQALMMELAPGEPVMSRDNLDSMKVDSVCSGAMPGFAPELGVPHPESLEAIAPTYLDPKYQESEYGPMRATAGR